MDPKTAFFTGVFLALWTSAAAGATGAASRRYHFVKDPKTWSDAQIYCRTNYVDLATVDNMEENERLVAAVRNAADGSRIWIGLQRAPTERWIWSEGIGEVTVYPWNISAEDGDCVIMRSTVYWLAVKCGVPRKFMCFEYDSDGREKYYLHTTPVTWRDAQTHCRAKYVDLVSVKTAMQNIEIHKNAGGNNVWIGLSREDWMWSDGSGTSFRNWMKGHPVARWVLMNCTAISTSKGHQWKDVSCDHAYPFVCHGDQKLKTTVVKMKIRSDVNLNLPAERESLLNQIRARLEAQGLADVKIRWSAGARDQPFTLEKDNEDKEKVDECIAY